jgi:hypothetical protein
MINPLAIGVTLGGMLLDVLVPRPKPLVGSVRDELAFVTPRPAEDTLVQMRWEHERHPVASGAATERSAGARRAATV